MKRITPALLFLSASLHAQTPVECDVPGIFPPGAVWQCLSSSHGGCEGAQWIGETLHYAAHHDGFAFKWSEETGLIIWRKDSPEPTSFRPDGAGGFYVVEQTTRQLTRWNEAGERVEVLADRFEGKRLNRPNDCVVKSDGSVWFTDPAFLFDKRPQDTRELPGEYVFRFDPKVQALTKVVDDLSKPNGIAFSPDEKHLLVACVSSADVFRFPVNADGTLGTCEVFATLPEKGIDGLTFDPEGRLWACSPRRGVFIIAPDGKVLGLLKTNGMPTSIAFGPDGRVCVTVRDACFITRINPSNNP